MAWEAEYSDRCSKRCGLVAVPIGQAGDQSGVGHRRFAHHPALWHCFFVDERIARLCAFVASLPQPRRPPIVVPDGCATAEQVFRHVDPAAIPEVADALEWLMEHQPGVIAATADEDRTLLWEAMERTPLENLAVAGQMSRGLGSDQAA